MRMGVPFAGVALICGHFDVAWVSLARCFGIGHAVRVMWSLSYSFGGGVRIRVSYSLPDLLQ